VNLQALLNRLEPLTFISLTSAQMNAVRKIMPELSPSKISTKVYASLDRDYETLGVFNFAVGRDDLPDDLAYRLVKAIFENRAEIVRSHPSARETVPGNVDKDTFLPFHPGAVRYYREIGIQIPSQLIPSH
jgi:TRAP transporter TAXI family solute receptor